MLKLFRLILGENCTIPNGTVIELVPEDLNGSKNETSDTDDYNAVGAMEFIVATILLYSILGVFCTLLIKIKRSRGKSYFNSLMDESVAKYLKEENSLKFDGQRTSLRRACRQVSQRLQEYEQKRSWLDMEREVSSEIAPTDTPELPNKKLRKKKWKEEEMILKDRIGNMELPFFAPGSSQEGEVISDRFERTVETNIPVNQLCHSLNSLGSADVELCHPLTKTVTTI